MRPVLFGTPEKGYLTPSDISRAAASYSVITRSGLRPGRAVTDEQIVAFCKMYRTGKTQAQCAAAVGVSYMTVRRWLKRLKLNNKPRSRRLTKDEISMLENMYRDGESKKTIAAALNVYQSTVWKRLKQVGLIDGSNGQYCWCGMCRTCQKRAWDRRARKRMAA